MFHFSLTLDSMLQVFNFFKSRIEMQYPLSEGKMDPYQASKEQHESFMKNRCTSVLGRDDVLQQVIVFHWIPYTP